MDNMDLNRVQKAVRWITESPKETRLLIAIVALPILIAPWIAVASAAQFKGEALKLIFISILISLIVGLLVFVRVRSRRIGNDTLLSEIESVLLEAHDHRMRSLTYLEFRLENRWTDKEIRGAVESRPSRFVLVVSHDVFVGLRDNMEQHKSDVAD